MRFPRCPRCGLAPGLACICALALAQPDSLCGQFDNKEGVYCASHPAELPHVPHSDGATRSMPRILIVASSTTASTTSSTGFPTSR